MPSSLRVSTCLIRTPQMMLQCDYKSTTRKSAQKERGLHDLNIPINQVNRHIFLFHNLPYLRSTPGCHIARTNFISSFRSQPQRYMEPDEAGKCACGAHYIRPSCPAGPVAIVAGRIVENKRTGDKMVLTRLKHGKKLQSR